MSELHLNLFPRPFVAKQHEPKVLYGSLAIEFSLQALTIFISDVYYTTSWLSSDLNKVNP